LALFSIGVILFLARQYIIYYVFLLLQFTIPNSNEGLLQANIWSYYSSFLLIIAGVITFFVSRRRKNNQQSTEAAAGISGNSGK
jgi:uncharacterized metal-binding protein